MTKLIAFKSLGLLCWISKLNLKTIKSFIIYFIFSCFENIYNKSINKYYLFYILFGLETKQQQKKQSATLNT